MTHGPRVLHGNPEAFDLTDEPATLARAEERFAKPQRICRAVSLREPSYSISSRGHLRCLNMSYFELDKDDLILTKRSSFK